MSNQQPTGTCSGAKSQVDKNATVDLFGMVELLHKHVTESLCEKVFRQNRSVERQRKWTLHAMVRFWLAVTIRAPKALTQALQEAAQGQEKLLPHVEATPEAFFEKSKDFHWSFFASLFNEIGARMLPETRCVYAGEAHDVRKHFPEIWVMDGSQLAEVVHRLKILWKVHGAVLPGRIFAFYDLFRGVARGMVFEPDAAKNENLLAKEGLDIVPEGTLLLADRLYGMPGYFHLLCKRKLWGVFRRHGSAKVKVLHVLRRRQGGRELLEDVLVRVGSGANGIAVQTLRLIRYRGGKRRLDLLTNVLEVEKLPAERVVELYGLRWGIERMFFDLKEVLNLNRFYAGNPNAIAMQVYAAVIVYNAFRIVQGRIGQRQGIAPETISPAKLFPKLAVASNGLAQCAWTWQETLDLNPGVDLRKPDFSKANWATTTLGAILVERKKGPRTKGVPNPCSTWLSWSKVRGGRKLLAKLS